MTARGGGTPDSNLGAPPSSGRISVRMVTVVALIAAAVLLVGLGASLLGSRGTSERVGGGAGGAGDVSPEADDPTGPPDSATTAEVAETSNSTSVPVDLELVDNSDAARRDLELHFANHARRDLDAAYAGLTSSFAPDFDEFVQFWSVEVASVDSPIDQCNVIGERGVCAVRFFITYSDVAEESVRNRCFGQSVELTMQRMDGRFLIDEQRDLGPLDCPIP